jgi:hypothetical protein
LIAGRMPGHGGAAGSVPLRHLGSEHSTDDTSAAGGVPLRHFGSVQVCGDGTASGGTPLMQSGVGHATSAVTGGGPPLQADGPPQALAGVAARLSEPTVRTAETSAPAITPLR